MARVVTGIVLDAKLVTTVGCHTIAMIAARLLPGPARIVAVSGVIAGVGPFWLAGVGEEALPTPDVEVEPPVAVGAAVPNPLETGSSMMRMVSTKLWNAFPPVVTRLNSSTIGITGVAPSAPVLMVGDGTTGPTAAGTFPIGPSTGWTAATERSCRDSSISAQNTARRRARAIQIR